MTLEFSYKRTTPNGKTQIISNPDSNVSIGNAWVRDEFREFLYEFSSTNSDGFYGVAYILAEHGEDLIEEVNEMEQDELKDYVLEIEERRATPSKQSREEEVSDLLDDANEAEAEAILEAAKEASEETEIDDVHAMKEAVNKGN